MCGSDHAGPVCRTFPPVPSCPQKRQTHANPGSPAPHGCIMIPRQQAAGKDPWQRMRSPEHARPDTDNAVAGPLLPRGKDLHRGEKNAPARSAENTAVPRRTFLVPAGQPTPEHTGKKEGGSVVPRVLPMPFRRCVQTGPCFRAGSLAIISGVWRAQSQLRLPTCCPRITGITDIPAIQSA